MDNKQVTAEWIAQQRQISEIVNMTYEDAPGSVVPLLKQLEKSQTAALDALEASMQREAEKEKEIKRLIHDYSTSTKRLIDEKDRLTAERDAAVCDLKYLSGEYKLCDTCKHNHGKGVWDCNDGLCDKENHYEWRGPTSANTDAPTGAESDPIKDVNMKGISIHNCGDVKSQKIISIKTMDDNIDL